ncbi:MAG: cupin domain-containing protein [Candidatus Binatia bacterium]
MTDLKEFSEDLKKKNMGGFWDIFEGEVYKEPSSLLEPCLWKWCDVYDAVNRAGEMIGVDSTSRRAIRLLNPSPSKKTTTNTLALAFQLVKPREHAPAHRHTQGAVRFVIQGKDAHCVVGGESFSVTAGDFLTTPNWVWHDHVNDSDQTLLFLDGLDNPLVRLLEVGFHDPLKEKIQPISKPENSSIYELSPTRPNWVRSDSIQPPPFCYRWEDTEKVLKSVGEKPGDAYEGILLNYVNPLTGGPTLPTLSCAIQMLRPDEKTKSHRHTSSAVYHVFRGKGSTVIGDVRYEWETGDSFVIPLWRFHHHENISDKEAILFVMTDKPVMDALGYYREETAN